MGQLVYKIFTPDEWQAFAAAGRFDGSAADLRDGFIHFSKADQLPGTLGLYYADEERVAIAAFPAERFDARLKWEPSRDGQLFPHLHGPLFMAQLESMEWIEPVPALPDDATPRPGK
jgi:uncharacterized protein (DUF952 family)